MLAGPRSMASLGSPKTEANVSDLADLKCDLCKLLPADDVFGVKRTGRAAGDELHATALCWKCWAKIGYDVSGDVFDEIVNNVLDNGTSLNLAIMFATGQGPTLHTDDTFFRGWQGASGAQFDKRLPYDQNLYMREAKEAGVSTNGKVYMHGLAEYPGDPRAWVGTKGEMKKRLEQKGWGCDRLGVKVRTDVEPEATPALAEDLVQEMVARKFQGEDDRAITPKKLAEAREAVIEKHGQKNGPTTPLKKSKGPKRKFEVARK